MLIGSNILITLAVAFAMRWLSKPTSAKINSQGMKVMRPAKGYKFIAWLFFWFTTAIVLLLTFSSIYGIPGIQNPELYDIVVAIIASLFFYSVSIWLILYERNARAIFDSSKIIYQGALGKPKSVLWKDVIKVTFSKAALQFYIETKRQRIPIHKHMSGFNELKEVLINSLSPELIKQALIDLDQVKGR